MTGADSMVGGPIPWARLVAEVLTGHTCLWQDLDGLHVASAPPEAPPTSILWAWTPAGAMARVRLEGESGYVATCSADVDATAVLPWAPTDGRIHAAARKAGLSETGLGLRLEQYVDDRLDAGTGPITFLRAARERA